MNNFFNMPNVTKAMNVFLAGLTCATTVTPALATVIYQATTVEDTESAVSVTENISSFSYASDSPVVNDVSPSDQPTSDDGYNSESCVVKIQTVDKSDGSAVGGGVYEVTKATGEWVGSFTADANGNCTTQTLEAGYYFVKQVVAPEGYMLDTNTVTINTLNYSEGSLLTAKFYNDKMAGLIIENVVQETYAPLAGCTFEVYNSNNIQIFSGVTPSHGYLYTGITDPGLYTIKQLTTVDGYSIVQSTRTVTVGVEDSFTAVFENTSLTNLRIFLFDENTRLPIQDAQFVIEDINGTYITTVTTDITGTAVIPALETGNYMVKQFTAPAGYILDGDYQWAKINTGEDTELTFLNYQTSGLVIRSMTHDGNYAVGGGVYEIYSQWDGKLVKTVTSDITGIINIDGLDSGTYLIKELSTPYGYTVTNNNQLVEITTDMYSTVTFLHTSAAHTTFEARSSLTGELLSDVSIRITTSTGEYVGDFVMNGSGQFLTSDLPAGDYIYSITSVPQGYYLDSTARAFTIRDEMTQKFDILVGQAASMTVYNTCYHTNNPIAGAQFKVYRLDGTAVGVYTTSDLGMIYLDLDPGEYSMVQTIPGEGYELNTQVYNVTMVKDMPLVMEVQNKQASHVRVKMVDAISQTGIYNVKLEIQDSKNNIIGTYQTDNEGYMYLDRVIADGSYTIRLLNVPVNYIMDSVPKTIKIEAGATADLNWALAREQGQVRITTYAGEDSSDMNIRKNTPLSGGEYVIKDSSGQTVVTITGDGSGHSYSGALLNGTYFITQTKAPTGFALNSTPMTVNITSSNQNVQIDMYNKATEYSMTVDVKGEAASTAGNEYKYYFYNVTGSATNSMDNFFMNVKIPTGELRATTFFTGTWATNAIYNLEFRTNTNGYRTLASNLSSLSGYSYDLTNLGLSDGEYVTDIRMAFNSVTAGFRESTPAAIYCVASVFTSSGSQATMQAELGGQIDGAWYAGGGFFTTGITSGIDRNPFENETLFGNDVGNYSMFNAYLYNNGYQYSTFPNSLPKTGY